MHKNILDILCGFLREHTNTEAYIETHTPNLKRNFLKPTADDVFEKNNKSSDLVSTLLKLLFGKEEFNLYKIFAYAANLRGINIVGLEALTNYVFCNVDFSNANIIDVSLIETKFTCCSFKGAVFSRLILIYTRMENIDITSSIIVAPHLVGNTFEKITAEKVLLKGGFLNSNQYSDAIEARNAYLIIGEWPESDNNLSHIKGKLSFFMAPKKKDFNELDKVSLRSWVPLMKRYQNRASTKSLQFPQSARSQEATIPQES